MSIRSNITVIVPTINRQNDLSRLLASIAKNTKLPNQLIIVEQGDIKKTEELPEIESLRTKIEDVSIIYSNQASLVRARNVGIEHARGALIVFLDDDAILARNYFENLIKIANEYKDVKIFAGIFQGHRTHRLYRLLLRILGTLFCVSTPWMNKNVVLPSGQNVFRIFDIQEPVYVEWVSGINMVIRRELVDVGLRFYEGFTKYSLGEDVFFTYSVYKKYGKKSILVHPGLQLKHSCSQEGKLDNQQLIKMRIIYKYIFWHKIVRQNIFHGFCYVLSEIAISAMILIRAEHKFAVFRCLLITYKFLMTYKKDILTSSIDFNAFIFHK